MPRLRISRMAALSRTRASLSRVLSRLLLSARVFANADAGAIEAMIRHKLTASPKNFVLLVKYNMGVRIGLIARGGGILLQISVWTPGLRRLCASFGMDLSARRIVKGLKRNQRFVTIQSLEQYGQYKNALGILPH